MYTPIMMNFNIITSICRGGGIGYKGCVPWMNSPTYTMLFTKLTHGNGNNAVLMGNNTYDKLMVTYCKPLGGRYNLVLSKETYEDRYSPYGNVDYFHNINSVISHCMETKYDDVWIIGGGQLFSHFLNQSKIPIKNIYFNYINKDYKCDTYIPMRFNENDKFETLDTQILNNVEQSIIKFDYNRVPV